MADWGLLDTNLPTEAYDAFQKGQTQGATRGALAMYATDPQRAMQGALTSGQPEAVDAVSTLNNNALRTQQVQAQMLGEQQKAAAAQQQQHFAHAVGIAQVVKRAQDAARAAGQDPTQAGLAAYDQIVPSIAGPAGWTSDEVASGRQLAATPGGVDQLLAAAPKNLEWHDTGNGTFSVFDKDAGQIVHTYQGPRDPKITSIDPTHDRIIQPGSPGNLPGMEPALQPGDVSASAAPPAPPTGAVPAETVTSGTPTSAVTASAADRDALIRMVATEAGNQGADGQAAVAHVALNRLRSGYGGAISLQGVVTAPNQFEGMKNAAAVTPAAYQRIAPLVDQILAGKVADPTNGATMFLNPQLQAQLGRAQPKWTAGPSQRIGAHVFYGGGAPAVAAGAQNAVATTGADTLQGGAGSDAAAMGLPPGWQYVKGAPKVEDNGHLATPADKKAHGWDASANIWLDKNGKPSVIKDLSADSGPGTLGDATKTGPEYLKTLTPADQRTVQALVEGRISPPTSFAAAKPYWQQRLAAAEQFDPSFNAQDFHARQKARNDFVAGKTRQNITAMNTALGHLGDLNDQIGGLHNVGIAALNSPINGIVEAMGGEEPGKFRLTASAAADELVKVFTGASGALEDRRHWMQMLGPDHSPAQLRANIQEAVHLLGSRLNGVADSYGQSMGRIQDPVRILSPQAASVYQRLTGGGRPAAKASTPASRPVTSGRAPDGTQFSVVEVH